MPSITPVGAPPAALPPNGLLASIPATKTNARWTDATAVIAYKPEGCVEGTTVDTCAPDPLDPVTSPDNVEWKAYALTLVDDCSTFSGDSVNPDRATRLLHADSERQLGLELWTGALAQASTLPDSDPYPNTWLADVANVDILTESGAVDVLDGLACLDAYLASSNSGSQGVIHATPQTLVHWTSLHGVYREDRKWYSPNGHLIVASPGYPGTSPDGVAGTNNIWAYATDMIRIFLDDILVPDPMSSSNRRLNTRTVYATRNALAEWQRCRHAGVRLALTECDSGGS